MNGGAVVLQTSGSSGSSKQVPVQFPITADDAKKANQTDGLWICGFHFQTFGALHTLSRSQRIGFSFCPLSIDETLHLNPSLTHPCCFLSLTTSQLRRLSRSPWPAGAVVKRVFIGGETVRDGDFNLASRMFPQAQIEQIFGTTESGVLMRSSSTAFDLTPLGPFDLKVASSGELLVLKDSKIFHTGDRFEESSPGMWRFLGRISREFKVMGRLVSPEKIEAILESQAEVSSATVRPLSSGLTENIVEATITPTYGTNVSELENTLRERLTGLLSEQERPHIYRFENAPRLTPMGKKDFL